MSIEMPTWEECRKLRPTAQTALTKFILAYEPHADTYKQWREDLRALVEAEHADAERYRECFRDGGNFGVVAINNGRHEWLADKAAADAEIDAARGAP